MASTYDLFQEYTKGKKGKAPPSKGFIKREYPLPFSEALYQAYMDKEIEENPEILDHFENSRILAEFVKDAETNRDYNIESGLDYALTTDKGFWETLPKGIGYAIIDSWKNKDQDFWDMEGGIGDLIRNMKGVAMATDTNPLGLFYDELEKENVLGEYEYKMRNKKARGGIIDIL